MQERTKEILADLVKRAAEAKVAERGIVRVESMGQWLQWSINGTTGWRLATRKECASLIDAELA